MTPPWPTPPELLSANAIGPVPIFDSFFGVTGKRGTSANAPKGSAAYTIDSFVVQVLIFDDMSLAERADMQIIGSHLRKDGLRKMRITINAAQRGGIIKAGG